MSGRFGIIVLLIAASPVANGADHMVTLHLAGDSTMAVRKAEDKVQSWGEMLRSRAGRNVMIRNYGKGGTSTVTFRKIWDASLIGNVKKGDFVVIQFGHNDFLPTEKRFRDQGEPERFCTPEQYCQNIRRYIADVRAREAFPVLMSTSPVRDFSGKDGEFVEMTERKRPYMDLLARIAQEEKVDFVDMRAIGNRVVKALGPERSKQLYICAFGGEDNVHPNECGARIFAELFLMEIRSRKLPIADLFPYRCEALERGDASK